MINYILVTIDKPNDLQTNEMHLLEHCYERKIAAELESELNCRGILINAETSMDSITLEIYFPFIEDRLTIQTILNSCLFSHADAGLIEEEIQSIKHETKTIDLTDEDTIIYKSIEYISNESIFDLYNQDFNCNDEYVTRFNVAIDNSSMLIYSSGKIIKCKTNVGRIEQDKKDQSYVSLFQSSIIGSYRFEILNVGDIIHGLFLSFLLGKNEKSIINKLYLNKFSLYWGYSVDMPLYNQFCTLFFIETNEESAHAFQNNLSLSFDDLSVLLFEEYKSAFLTYFSLTDPHLVNFCKYYNKLNVNNPNLDLKDIEKEIESIEYNVIKKILKEGVSNFYKK